jgi:hypothetical protein
VVDRFKFLLKHRQRPRSRGSGRPPYTLLLKSPHDVLEIVLTRAEHGFDRRRKRTLGIGEWPS